MNKVKELQRAHKILAETKEYNAKQAERVTKEHRDEAYQRAKYYAPQFFPKFRRSCRGTDITNEPYNEKVSWLTPWESFCYDVKKLLKKIGGLCHGR